MKLSFITATYNNIGYTKEMLASFKATVSDEDYEYEYLMVDDGSTDGTRDFLKTLRNPFKIMINEANSGFAISNNRAARKATGDYLVFLNNDLLLTPHWLEPMLAAFDRFPKTAAVGNIQLNAKTKLIDHAGVFFDLEGLPLHARKKRKRLPKPPYTEWNAITAACMILPRALFLKNGGFDEAYINGSEDIDLCVRLRNDNYRLFVANKSVIYHHVSPSPGRHLHNDRNTQRFLQKWQNITAEWGGTEWPTEYLSRYARQFWKFNLKKLLKALFRLAYSKPLQSKIK